MEAGTLTEGRFSLDEPRICGGRGTTAYFDDMAWPRADNTTGAVEYVLRHNDDPDGPPRDCIMTAASVIAAYRELVWCPRAKREAVIRRLREVARKFPADEDGDPIGEPDGGGS